MKILRSIILIVFLFAFSTLKAQAQSISVIAHDDWIEVTYSAGSLPTGGVVERSLDGTTWTAVANTGFYPMNPLEVRGFNAGGQLNTSYSFRFRGVFVQNGLAVPGSEFSIAGGSAVLTLGSPSISGKISWSAFLISVNPISKAKGYMVYRNGGYVGTAGNNGDGTWGRSELPSTPTQAYYYYVRAYNNAGIGEPSNVITSAILPGGGSGGGLPPYDGCVKPEDSCSGGFSPAAGGLPAASTGVGGKAGDPVDLANGQENYTPPSHISVYNPTGVGIDWRLNFRDSQRVRGYGSPGLSPGWVHPYDVIMYPNGSGWTSMNLIFPTGATVPMSVNTTTWKLAGPNGTPLMGVGTPGSTTNQWNDITVTWKDGTKWYFTPFTDPNVATPYMVLSRITNRVGNGISLTWNSGRILTQISQYPGGTPLLTFSHTLPSSGGYASGLYTAASDAYGRSVYYKQIGAQTWLPLLTEVSQVVSTGTTTPPARFTYTDLFAASASDPSVVGTISVPSPTGTGMSVAKIHRNPTSFKVDWVEDGNGNKTHYTYNSGNTKVETRDSLGNLVHSYTQNYDGSGRATGTVDSNAATTQIQYNSTTTPNRPSRIIDEMGRQTDYTYDTFGNILTSVSPRSIITTYTYNYSNFSFGRLTQMQEGSKPAVNFTYYEPSGLVQSVTGPSPTGTGTVTTSYSYDAMGNVLTVVAPGNSVASTITTTFNYTTDGAYSQTAALGQPLTITNNLGQTSHARYDAQGRLTQAWDALGNTTDVTYNLVGQAVQLLLPATGQQGILRTATISEYLYPGGPLTRSRLYDESGTLVREVNQSYGQEGESLSTTGSTEPQAQTYDALYRLKTLTDANGNSTAYTYDAVGNLTQIDYPGGDTVQFSSHAADGAVLQRIDGRGIVANYTYADAEGQLTAIAFPAYSTQNVTLTYDSYGLPQSRTDAAGTQTYTYNTSDTLTGISTAYTGLSTAQALTYSYFADGSRAGVSTPAGAFTYTYDGAGRMVSVTNPQAEMTQWSYLANGWLWKQRLPNDMEAVYTYNALGQVSELQNAHIPSGGSTTIQSKFDQIMHDGAGNRLSVTASFPALVAYSGSTNYGYDVKDQLSSEISTRAGSFSQSYGYDAAGNPTNFKGLTRSYNVKNQVTSGTGLGAFVYDGNGNPTTFDGISQTFDVDNRLTSHDASWTAGYFSTGHRAWKQTDSSNPATRTYFVYDGDTPILELDSTGQISAINTFGANGLVSRRSNNATVFYAFDERGNVAQQFDAFGNIISSHVTDAFGTTVNNPINASVSPFGFGGQFGYYTDEETGLVLCTHRYYSTKLGRWITRDPIGYEGGINLYGYVTNNPTMLVDPEGLDPSNVYIISGDQKVPWIQSGATRMGVSRDIRTMTGRFSAFNVKVVKYPSKTQVLSWLSDDNTRAVIFMAHCATENSGIQLRPGADPMIANDEDFLTEDEIGTALKKRKIALGDLITHVCFSDNDSMRKAIQGKVKSFEGSKGYWTPFFGFDMDRWSFRGMKSSHKSGFRTKNPRQRKLVGKMTIKSPWRR